MPLSRTLARAALATLSALAVAACTAEASWQPTPGPGGAVPVAQPASGRITVDFTVSGTRDPAICGAHRATELEILVYDDAGQSIATAYGPCEGFAVALDLPEGRYHAQAQLVDARRQPVSTTLPLSDLDVVAGTDLKVTADFPAGSFL
jgi:hypothetical protein